VPTFLPFGPRTKLGETAPSRCWSFLRKRRGIGPNLVFWNVRMRRPSSCLAKAPRSHGAGASIDVSPGDRCCFRELDQTGELQHRIAFDSARLFFAASTGFIAKYGGGAPPQHYGFDPAPCPRPSANGVPLSDRAAPAADAAGCKTSSRSHASCRNKQIERLLAMNAHLA